MGRPAVRRVFEVDVGQHEAWERLAQVERWPEWAPHIRAVTVSPPGPLGPASRGTLHLKRLGPSTFRMAAWEPPVRWLWVGGFPGLQVRYDHRFSAVGASRTRLEWTVDLDGVLASVVRPVFVRVYERNLDRAVPRLVRWIVDPHASREERP